MDINNPHNQHQGYWFVLREDQSNVIFSSNNFTIQNPQIAGQDTSYIVDTGDRQYIQIHKAPVVVQENIPEPCEKETTKIKDEDNFWDRNKIKLLLTLCLENKIATKDKTFWDEIATHLGTTADDCSKKYRNLRRTYLRLLKKKRLGKEIKWVHYSTCEEIFLDCKSLPTSAVEPWEEHQVRRLLSLYIENLSKFRNSDYSHKDVWKEIASQMGTTEYNCYHKFKNLKRSYLNWQERSRETGKPINWQYHQYFERIFYNHNPNMQHPWDKNKTRLLIDAYMQIADKFKNPRYQKKELWKEISAAVGEDATNCDKKFRNLKQTYIRLKMKQDAGRCITKWRYYKDFEEIYREPTIYSVSSQGITKLSYKSNEEDYVKQLLSFYVENKERFKDPLVKKKSVWRSLAPKIGLSTEECDRKFRNLKQTYLRLAERKKEKGKTNSWPYYSYFEKIYDEPTPTGTPCNHVGLDNISMTEIKRVVQEAHQNKDNDRFEVLVKSIEETNNIQRERNRILQGLLDKVTQSHI